MDYKHNNYTPDVFAPGKVCSICGSVNHLYMHCIVVAPSLISPSMSALVNQNLVVLISYPIYPNTYFQYGNINMPSMPWGTPPVNNSILINIMMSIARVILRIEILLCPKGQKPTPR